MASRGFTLMELLVVLAIMAILAGIAMPTFVGRSTVLAVESGAQAIADALGRTRGRAISTNRAAAFTLNIEERWFRAAAESTAERLPDEAKISFVTARSEVLNETVARIRFYPDGSSSGGRIILAAQDRQYAVLVDWLTGRVRVTE